MGTAAPVMVSWFHWAVSRASSVEGGVVSHVVGRWKEDDFRDLMEQLATAVKREDVSALIGQLRTAISLDEDLKKIIPVVGQLMEQKGVADLMDKVRRFMGGAKAKADKEWAYSLTMKEDVAKVIAEWSAIWEKLMQEMGDFREWMRQIGSVLRNIVGEKDWRKLWDLTYLVGEQLLYEDTFDDLVSQEDLGQLIDHVVVVARKLIDDRDFKAFVNEEEFVKLIDQLDVVARKLVRFADAVVQSINPDLLNELVDFLNTLLWRLVKPADLSKLMEHAHSAIAALVKDDEFRRTVETMDVIVKQLQDPDGPSEFVRMDDVTKVISSFEGVFRQYTHPQNVKRKVLPEDLADLQSRVGKIVEQASKHKDVQKLSGHVHALFEKLMTQQDFLMLVVHVQSMVESAQREDFGALGLQLQLAFTRIAAEFGATFRAFGRHEDVSKLIELAVSSYTKLLSSTRTIFKNLVGTQEWRSFTEHVQYIFDKLRTQPDFNGLVERVVAACKTIHEDISLSDLKILSELLKKMQLRLWAKEETIQQIVVANGDEMAESIEAILVKLEDMVNWNKWDEFLSTKTGIEKIALHVQTVVMDFVDHVVTVFSKSGEKLGDILWKVLEHTGGIRDNLMKQSAFQKLVKHARAIADKLATDKHCKEWAESLSNSFSHLENYLNREDISRLANISKLTQYRYGFEQKKKPQEEPAVVEELFAAVEAPVRWEELMDELAHHTEQEELNALMSTGALYRLDDALRTLFEKRINREMLRDLFRRLNATVEDKGGNLLDSLDEILWNPEQLEEVTTLVKAALQNEPRWSRVVDEVVSMATALLETEDWRQLIDEADVVFSEWRTEESFRLLIGQVDALQRRLAEG